ncbi:response regulator transcription factor [Paenibacillus alginolyticus]|uniref:response regulator transcription factor n=1 Tax=Paenibacillus alginolyticus TaxID=59839 RepID=UPI00040A5A95|nr:response regulator transcription factor [Paenibacillus alginolyticus]MCY9670614.1 response regulator transcription factor [Paenibacillus alginolyticus]
MKDKKFRVLIIDDEANVRSLLRMHIEKDEFIVDEAEESLLALTMVQQNHYDAILLDWVMPDLDGRAFCRQIREVKQTPLLLLSAKSGVDDRIAGFQAGVDDFVSKPFSPREVLLRIKAIVRRFTFLHHSDYQISDTKFIHFPQLTIDLNAYKVIANGISISLTLKEFQILLYLARNHDIVFTREELFTQIWQHSPQGDCRTIDTHIKRIREKLLVVSPLAADMLRTKWGIGYSLKL